MPASQRSPRTVAGLIRKAQQHLTGVHPVFSKLVGVVGPCTLRAMDDHFLMLVSTVVSQQISTKAAESITGRIIALAGKRGLTPKAILKASDDELRACGLSGSKLRTIRELAARVADRRLDLRKLAHLDDDGIAEHLLPIPGIGPWSVQMVLIFGLCRLDVLPVGDLGFRQGVQELFGFDEMPTAVEMERLAEPWRPYRTVATWYVWRSRRMKLPSDAPG